MLDLNEVAMFVQVVRSGSFAEAARRLSMPSPTVSRRIQQLEARLGTRLMQRSTRKLELTSAGRAFYERCGPAIKELIEAGQLQMADSTAPSGPVRVAVPTLFFDFFDMAWVAAFLEAHPLVTLDFVPSDLQLDLIADRIDVAFCSGPLQDSSYAARKICASDAELIASPAYLTAQGMPASPEDLSEHACVVQSDASGSTWRLRDMAGVETDVRVQGRFKSNAHQALRKAACAGLGIAALPSILTAADVAAGRLVRVLPGYTRVGPGLNVVYPSRGRRPLAVSMFVEMVVERLSLKDHAATSRAIA